MRPKNLLFKILRSFGAQDDNRILVKFNNGFYYNTHERIIQRELLLTKGSAATAAGFRVRVAVLKAAFFEGINIMDFDALEVFVAFLVDKDL